MFRPNLVLRRRIAVRFGEARVQIEDIVENEGHDPAPLMLLYHLNLGWPLLDDTARLIGPGKGGETPGPRDEEVRGGLDG